MRRSAGDGPLMPNFAQYPLIPVFELTQHGQRKVMSLDAVEFLRRFLLHALPKGYTRLRHFGLCAARNLHTKLDAARGMLMADNARPAVKDDRPWWKRFLDRTGIDLLACPRCTAGRLIRLRHIEPLGRIFLRPTAEARTSGERHTAFNDSISQPTSKHGYKDRHT
jgi:hypothetical protein